MQLFMTKRNVFSAAGALVFSCGVLAAAVSAQTSDNNAPAGNDHQPVLSGPKVSDDAAKPDGPAKMGPNAAQRRAEPKIPQRMWMREFEKLNISAEQQAQVDEILAEFHAEQQSYREVYGKQVDALMAQVRQARRDRQEIPLETRKQFQKLRESAPKFEDYQQRIWGVLDANQREQLTNSLNEAMEQLIERNAPGNRRGAGARRGGNPDAMTNDGEDAEAAPRHPGRDRWRDFDERGRHRMEFLMRHRLRHPGAQADEDEMDGAPGADRPRHPGRLRRGEGADQPPPPPPPGMEGELPPPPPPPGDEEPN